MTKEELNDKAQQQAIDNGGTAGGGMFVDLDVRPGFASVRLPSGWLDGEGVLHKTVVVKEMGGKSEDTIASAMNGKLLWADAVNSILTNEIISIDEITDTRTISIAASSMPEGDRIAIMVALRSLSLGDQYKVKITCEKCKTVDVDNVFVPLNELESIEPEDPHRQEFIETFKPGGLFSSARWRVLNGKSAKELEQLARTHTIDDVLTYMIVARVISFDDKQLDLATKKGIAEAITIVKSLRMRDRAQLRTQFKRHEGGIEMSFEHECCNPACGRIARLPIPMGVDFFLQLET